MNLCPLRSHRLTQSLSELSDHDHTPSPSLRSDVNDETSKFKHQIHMTQKEHVSSLRNETKQMETKLNNNINNAMEKKITTKE